MALSEGTNVGAVAAAKNKRSHDAALLANLPTTSKSARTMKSLRTVPDKPSTPPGHGGGGQPRKFKVYAGILVSEACAKSAAFAMEQPFAATVTEMERAAGSTAAANAMRALKDERNSYQRQRNQLALDRTNDFSREHAMLMQSHVAEASKRTARENESFELQKRIAAANEAALDHWKKVGQDAANDATLARMEAKQSANRARVSNWLSLGALAFAAVTYFVAR